MSPSAASNADLADAQQRELMQERAVVLRINDLHQKNVEAARALAVRLAEDAAVQTEDGIRDLVDEDDEADAAIQAAIVRQNSAAAMHAYRRLNQLSRMGDARAFGHTTDDLDDRVYVGRATITEGDEVLMVDWRARAAEPFYRATPLDRKNVRHRRHLLYDDGAPNSTPELRSYSDEVFSVDSLSEVTGLRGEAAILATVSAPTDEQMKSVVATIQAEQDAVVRAPADRVLVVQGAPGTGKTVVALHRAAYLLYNQRTVLAETGVLIVGPTNDFLAWISQVLPSLGESGVVLATPTDLYPRVRMRHDEDDTVAALKGTAPMADLLAHAVALRQREPQRDLTVTFGTDRVRIRRAGLVELFTAARRQKTHNAGAAALRMAIIDQLARQVWDPSFISFEEAQQSFAESATVRHFMLGHWPTLTPEQALNDLFGSSALLRLACRRAGLSPQDADLLGRERVLEAELIDAAWTQADIPLLDELLALVGEVRGDDFTSSRVVERDAADEFELEDVDDRDWSTDELPEDQEPDTVAWEELG